MQNRVYLVVLIVVVVLVVGVVFYFRSKNTNKISEHYYGDVLPVGQTEAEMKAAKEKIYGATPAGYDISVYGGCPNAPVLVQKFESVSAADCANHCNNINGCTGFQMVNPLPNGVGTCVTQVNQNPCSSKTPCTCYFKNNK